MTACPLSTQPVLAPAPARSLARRLFDGFWRHYHWPVLVSRELVDRAWLDAGLGRLDRPTLDEHGAPTWVAEREEDHAAWRTLEAVDRTRRM